MKTNEIGPTHEVDQRSNEQDVINEANAIGWGTSIGLMILVPIAAVAGHTTIAGIILFIALAIGLFGTGDR